MKELTNGSLLGEALLDSGITIAEMSQKIGITKEKFWEKINNQAEFQASEIVSMQMILKLSDEKRDRIFFCKQS